MRHAGIQLAALLLIAFIGLNAQCMALCAVGICPVPPDTTPHPQCPHHQNRKAPAPGTAHSCAPQQVFLARNSSETIPVPAMAALAVPAASLGFVPAAASSPLSVTFTAGPPGMAPNSRPVLRI